MIRIRAFKELLLIFIFKVMLELSYVLYVSKHFEYMGFSLDYSLSKWILSNVIMLFLYFLLRNNSMDYSYFFLKFFLILMVIPTLSLYALKGTSTPYMLMFSISFFITILTVKIPKFKIPIINLSKVLIHTILNGIMIIMFLNLFIYNGFPKLTAINLLDVYDVRESVVYGSSFMGYLRPWVAKVIIPFYIGITFYRKKINIMFIYLLLQFILFLYTGHKSYVFYPVLTISLITLVEKKNLIVKFLILLTSGIAIVLLLALSQVNTTLASLFIRRTFFITSQNHFHYYEYFKEYGFVKLSHSIFRGALDYPYSMLPQNLIGKVFYHNETAWVNTGYLGDAYMNFGFIGMIIFSMVLGLLLLLIDSLQAPFVYKIIALFIPMYSLKGGALLTSLLTGGILLGIIVVYFFSIIQEKEEKEIEDLSHNISS